MNRNEEIKNTVEIGKSYIDGTLPEHLRQALQTLIQLAEDYLAIPERLFPEEDYGEHGDKDKWSIDLNYATHEVRLRMIKNMMTVEEISKIIDDFLLYEVDDSRKERSGEPIYFKDYNKPVLKNKKRLAQAIFDAMEGKIGGKG